MAITIDEMLDLLSFAGAELGSGNANHGPMAAEALFALGRDEAARTPSSSPRRACASTR